MNSSKRFPSLFSMDTTLFEEFIVVTTKFYKTEYQWFLTILYESMEMMRSALDSVKKLESKIYGSDFGTSSSRRSKCVERSGEYLVCNVVSLSLQNASAGSERAETALSARRLLARVLDELFRESLLALFVSCVKEQRCTDGVRVFGGNV